MPTSPRPWLDHARHTIFRWVLRSASTREWYGFLIAFPRTIGSAHLHIAWFFGRLFASASAGHRASLSSGQIRRIWALRGRVSSAMLSTAVRASAGARAGAEAPYAKKYNSRRFSARAARSSSGLPPRHWRPRRRGERDHGRGLPTPAPPIEHLDLRPFGSWAPTVRACSAATPPYDRAAPAVRTALSISATPRRSARSQAASWSPSDDATAVIEAGAARACCSSRALEAQDLGLSDTEQQRASGSPSPTGSRSASPPFAE